MEISNIRCPNCGGNVRFGGSEDTVYCDYCGSLLGIERDVEAPTPVLIHSTGKRSGAYTGVQKRDKNNPPQPAALYYFIVFLLPILGFIWAMQYRKSGNESARTFANRCLTIAIVKVIAEGIFVFVVVIASMLAGVS